MENEENSTEIRDDGAYEKEIKVFWKNLTVRYWYYILIFGLLILGAIAGFLLTLNWFVNKTPVGSGTLTVGQMSIRSSILWFVMFIVWELLIVALPTLLVGGGVAAVIWFVLLPEDLKEECKGKFKKAEKHEEGCKRKHKKKGGHRSSQSGGAFTFLVFVGVLIYIAVDGNWNVPFETSGLTISYFVSRWIQVFLWGLLILGVPAITFGLLWYWKKFGKE